MREATRPLLQICRNVVSSYDTYNFTVTFVARSLLFYFIVTIVTVSFYITFSYTYPPLSPSNNFIIMFQISLEMLTTKADHSENKPCTFQSSYTGAQ